MLERVYANPDTGVLILRGMKDCYAILAAGTYVLPNLNTEWQKGTRITIIATGSVTVNNGSSVLVTSLTNGQAQVIVATSLVAWAPASIASTSAITDANSLLDGTTVEEALQQLASRTKLDVVTSISTAGAGVLTAAGIVGGVITRTGPSAAYTDTTVTGAAIAAAIGAPGYSESWYLVIKNLVAFTQTLAADTGVTLAGQTVIPANSAGLFHVVLAGEDATITGLGIIPQCHLPNGQYNTTAVASPVTPAAGILTGAHRVYYEVTTDGAFGITTRTAAEMYADIPNCHIGFTYELTVVNRGNNTVTITAGDSVTITASENTLATLVTRTYLVRFTSATACTWSSLSKGTIET